MGEKHGEKKAADGGESFTVVLKLDLHCEGCARKVRRSVSHFEGVEKVKADWEGNKLTVTGNVDPTWLRERVEHKTKKKVDLISPNPKKDAGAVAGNKKSDEKSDKKSEEKNKSDDKKPKEPALSTAMMKIKLHCDGCAHKITRVITKKIDGVKSVTTDLENDLVTVTGTMDTKKLPSYLQEKLGRTVDMLPPPAAAAGDKKEGKKKEEGGGDHSKATAGGEGKAELSKMEYHSLTPQTYYAVPQTYYNQSYANQDYGVQQVYHHPGYANHGYGYAAEYGQGPPPPPPPPPQYMNINDQMFSDENPNGCSVM